MVSALEKSIAQYKEEYAMLISEAQAIKADLTAVESKVQHHFFFFSSYIPVFVFSLCLVICLQGRPTSGRLALLDSLHYVHLTVAFTVAPTQWHYYCSNCME